MCQILTYLFTLVIYCIDNHVTILICYKAKFGVSVIFSHNLKTEDTGSK